MKASHLVFLLSIFSYVAKSQEKPSQTLIFPNFHVVISDFISEGPPSFPQGDNIPSDTIMISENPCQDDGYYIAGKILTLMPLSAKDRFTVSYSCMATIRQYPYPDPEMRTTEEYLWSTPQMSIPLSPENTLEMPIGDEEGPFLETIRNQFGLRDTSISVQGEMPHHLRFIKEGKYYTLSWDWLQLEICRYEGKKKKEVKYIWVGLSEGCD